MLGCSLDFYTACDQNGTSKVYYDGRQLTYGPEDKRLLDAHGDLATFAIEVTDARVQSVRGIVRANKNPLTNTDEKKIRVVIGYGQSNNLGTNGAISVKNPKSDAWFIKRQNLQSCLCCAMADDTTRRYPAGSIRFKTDS